ncbi:Ctr copper transporter, partial [Mycena metata]
MLWNWDTVDACFISEQWHIHTIRQYAGSLIALFFIVVMLEGVRRLARIYDRYILRRYQSRLANSSLANMAQSVRNNQPFKPSLFQHFIRSLFYFCQFSTAYLLMLATMTHNGGVIFSVFGGALFGFLIFGRDTVPGAAVIESSDY